jgi:hypothetical protein
MAAQPDEAIDKIKARNLKLEPGGMKESFKFLGSGWIPGSTERTQSAIGS